MYKRQFVSTILLLTASGCGNIDQSENHVTPTRHVAAECPIYIVDDLLSDQIGSCSVLLRNNESDARVFIFNGVTCSCLAGEHDGKELVLGDQIRVAGGDSEKVVLHTRLAYREGFYSNSAVFSLAGRPSRQVVVESRYGILKSLSISPGALVFDAGERSDEFIAKATVKFRFKNLHCRAYRLSVANQPSSISSHVTQVSKHVEKQMPPATGIFYEDIWKVLFRIETDPLSTHSLSPYGEIDLVVQDSNGRRIDKQTLVYNASCAEMARGRQ